MDAKTKILAYLARRRSATGGELRSHLGISRQALSIHVRSLIEAAKVVRSGAARGARYMLRSRAPAAAAVSRVLRIRGLDESRVWEELATGLNLRRALRPNVEAIVHYALTEMLNNAIEHSEASRCSVRFRLEPGILSFEIRDPGIGVFHSIASKLRLAGEPAALVELLKGRTTTMREAHTGEGIFFTSRMFDSFDILSGGVFFTHSFGDAEDWIMEREQFMSGTIVWMKLDNHTARTAKKVFDQYAPGDEFGFNKTVVPVKLAQYGNDKLISRSQAKRVLARVELFKVVIFNFQGVPTIGQAFADEIFRVFPAEHPEIALFATNANSEVKRMIARAKSTIDTTAIDAALREQEPNP